MREIFHCIAFSGMGGVDVELAFVLRFFWIVMNTTTE
jgi:hypothetical protein